MNKETKIGVLAAISIAIFYFGSVYLKGKHLFNTDYLYYAIYDNSNGLKETSPVLYKGVAVGKVMSLEITEENTPKIKVTFSVKKTIKLTSTTEAQSTASMLGPGLGNSCINLVINEGHLLTPNNLVIGVMDVGITDKINPTIQSLEQLLFVINSFLFEIAKSTDKISAIFVNLELITNRLGSILAKNEKTISDISTEIYKLINLINDPIIGMKPLLSNINSISTDLNSGVLKNYLEKVNNILINLDSIIEKTTKGQNSLGRLTSNTEFYDNLNNTIVSTNNLMDDLKTHPWRYLNFSIFGGDRYKKKSKHTNVS